MPSSAALFLTINHWCAQFPDIIWMTLCLFGSGWAVFALTSPSIVFAPRIFMALVIGAPIAGLLSRALKVMIDAPRPAAVLEPGTFHLIGKALKTSSMPSGHTLTAFMVATTIFLSITPSRRQYFWWLFLFAIATGLARIAVGAHWVEDTLLGAALGVLAGFIGVMLTQKLPNRIFEKHSTWLRVLSLLLLVAIYPLLTQSMDFDASRPTQIALAIIAIASFAKFWIQSVRK